MAQNQLTYTLDIDGETRVIKTLADLAKAGRDTNKAIAGLDIGQPVPKAMANTKVQVQQLTAQMKVLDTVAHTTAQGGMKRVTKTTNQAGVAMQNMNFVIRDSPYFFKDLQLGVLAVGNNINPLIDSFINLRKQAKLTTQQTGKLTTSFMMLKKSMMGGMGLSLAMSVLVTGFQAVIFSMDSKSKAARDLSDKIKDLWDQTYLAGEAFEKFSEDLKEFSAGEIEQTLLGLEKKIRELGDPGLWEGFKYQVHAVLGKSQSYMEDLTAEFFNFSKQLQLTNALTGRRAQVDRISNEVLGHNKVVIREIILLHGLLNYEVRLVVQNLRDQLKNTKAGSEANRVLEETIRNVTEAFKLDNEEKKKAIKMTADQIALFDRGIEARQEFYAPPPKDYLVLTPEQEMALHIEKGVISERIELRLIEKELIERMRTAQRLAAKELADKMKMVQSIVGQLGSAISNAMMTGEIAVGRFIAAVMAAIAQMLILKFIMGMLFPGVGGQVVDSVSNVTGGGIDPTNVTAPLPSQVNNNGNMGGTQTIIVEGSIRTDKNQFVADLNDARKSYDNNKRFVTVGR